MVSKKQSIYRLPDCDTCFIPPRIHVFIRTSSSNPLPAVHDTIFAPSTAPGRAGIAVVRISGVLAARALAHLGVNPLPAPRMATLVHIKAPDGESIDRALALWFPAPASFTGEDVAELHLHGSRAVMKEVLAVLGSVPGCRLAEPGEFSRRALENGKMDLLELEGMADLIDADTESQRRQALRALSGETGRKLEELRALMIRALAHLEAYIDFPDEKLPDTLTRQVENEVQSVIHVAKSILQDARRGERIREGISVVILGAPNAGKSSLMNALSRRDAAIVSHIAGTTRDVIETHLDLGGYSVVLVDTAGLRESADPIEMEGIRRARQRAEQADIRIVLFDGTRLPALDATTLPLLSGPALAVISKADRLSAPAPARIGGKPPFLISMNDPASLAGLLEAIHQYLQASFSGSAEPLLTRARHRQHLLKSLEFLQRFSLAEPLELACEDLRLAAAEIGKITGKILTDELLDVVFREFCIGK